MCNHLRVSGFTLKLLMEVPWQSNQASDEEQHWGLPLNMACIPLRV